MTTRLTTEQHKEIKKFRQGKQYMTAPEALVRLAYGAHVKALLAERGALLDIANKAIYNEAVLRRQLEDAKAGLVWRNEPPTEPGLYWLRSKWSIANKMPPMLVEVYRGVGGELKVLFHGSEREGSVYDDPSNQWIGPIIPPEHPP